MSKLSAPERSQDSYYKKINKLLNNPNIDNHSQALANVLMADFYILKDEFKQAKEHLNIAKPLLETVQSDELQHEYDAVNIFILRSEGNLQQATTLAQQLYRQVKESWPKHKLSNLVLEYAYLLSFQYKYNEALEQLEVALVHAFESNDPHQITETYNVFGILYSDLNDNPSAIMYFEKAIDMMEKHPELTQNSYLYTNLADSYRLAKEYDKSKALLDKSFEQATKDNDVSAISFVHQMRNRLLVDQGDYEGALNHLLVAKQLNEQLGEELFNYEIHTELTYIYLKLGKMDDAKFHLEFAEQHSEKQGDNDRYYIERLRAEILFTEGKFEEAYENLYKSYKNYRIQFNDNLTHVSNISREHLDQERLSFENKLLEQENSLNAQYVKESKKYSMIQWLLIGLLIVVIAIAIWMMMRFRKLAADNQRIALTDNLTKMPNRRHVFRTLQEFHSGTEGGKKTYSIILFDLDHFKSINDRFGHNVGDKVIQATNDICRAILREQDTIGRIGGEEFLIILPDTKLNDAYNIAERIREHFEGYNFEHVAQGLKVTSSFGVTEYLPDDETLDLVINRADRLLYKAKNEGRNRVFCSFI